MFRARKPSVKRQKIDDPSPRKRAKLTNPVKELLKKEANSPNGKLAKPSVTSNAGDSSTNCPPIREASLPKSKKKKQVTKSLNRDASKAIRVDEDSVKSSSTPNTDELLVSSSSVREVTPPSPSQNKDEDEKKVGFKVAKKIGEVSPWTVECTSEDVEQDSQVLMIETKLKDRVHEEKEKKTDEEEEEDQLELTNDVLKDSSICDNEVNEEKRQSNVDEEDATRLWPPYDNVQDDEFVSVRSDRVIESENDPVIDAALNLLP